MSDGQKFSLRGFLKSFTAPEIFRGDTNKYVVIATSTEKSKLGMHLEAAVMPVAVHGTKTNCLGIGLRLVEIGAPSFAAVLGSRTAAKFKDAADDTFWGHRMVKVFLPVMQFPCDPVTFRAYSDGECFPALLVWLKEQVKLAGGTMSISDDELMEAMLDSVSGFQDTKKEDLKLFALPGVQPDWYKEAPAEPVYPPTKSPFADSDVEESDDDDEEEEDGEED